MVRVIDLNADVAEGETLGATDLAVLDSVTSASLACGFHAGNRAVMRAAATACVHRRVAIGAHVSFRDREGFGRRPLDVAPEHLVADIIEQCDLLAEEVGRAGGAVEFVKPHGALYNLMGVDPGVADAVVGALRRQGAGVLVAQAGTGVVALARRAGLRVVLEGFPDRGYLGDGQLAPRGGPGALIDDPRLAARRAVSLVRRQGIETVDGTWTSVEVETLCIHGDSPGAVANARAVRSALEADGVTLRSFVGPGPVGVGGPGGSGPGAPDRGPGRAGPAPP
jgi:5-oxoprolinase (ATP-hydrolysing) subunit A